VPDYDARRIVMVDTQVRPSDVTKFPIIEAMLAVPREMYVPQALREAAYMGANLALGDGRVLLEPRTLAKLLDAVDIGPRDVVLDIGCGLGYSTAVMARIAEFVVAVEDDGVRATEAQSLLSESGIDNAAVLEGPLAEGAASNGPYDVIVVQGGVERVPAGLLDQLRDGGRIGCVFAEGALGVVRIGHKTDGRVAWRFSFNAGAPVLAGFEKADAFVL
jgi:protein-L-isoaspartate(D-aspartate) O-methyltransferase